MMDALVAAIEDYAWEQWQISRHQVRNRLGDPIEVYRIEARRGEVDKITASAETLEKAIERIMLVVKEEGP